MTILYISRKRNSLWKWLCKAWVLLKRFTEFFYEIEDYFALHGKAYGRDDEYDKDVGLALEREGAITDFPLWTPAAGPCPIPWYGYQMKYGEEGVIAEIKMDKHTVIKGPTMRIWQGQGAATRQIDGIIVSLAKRNGWHDVCMNLEAEPDVSDSLHDTLEAASCLQDTETEDDVDDDDDLLQRVAEVEKIAEDADL